MPRATKAGPKPAAKKSPAKKSTTKRADSTDATATDASRLIDQRIADLGPWRGPVLARMRALIREADPEVTEEWKWENPVWSHDGILCTGEAYAKTVKLTFAKGASLPDPKGVFNSSLEGNTRRAIDLREGDEVDAAAFKALVKAAVLHNRQSRDAKPAAAKTKPAQKVTLLSGGNPQIPKGDGDAPVQAYIAAMPEWKRDLGRRLDALIERAVPGVQKAVKWNTPFYGLDGRTWFVSFHVFAKYLKVTFFRGQSLKPVPPEPSKVADTRYVHLTPDNFDEALLTSWVEQAAALPGEKL